MSLFIKGAHLPRSCYECEVAKIPHIGNAFCPYMHMTVSEYRTRRHPCCPAKPVPPQHGRLIDADAVKRNVEKLTNAKDPYIKTIATAVISVITSELSVIEAEDKK